MKFLATVLSMFDQDVTGHAFLKSSKMQLKSELKNKSNFKYFSLNTN